MQDDKTDNSAERSQINKAGDNKAEQKPRNEEYSEEAEQLLKLHRFDKVLTPQLFLGIVNVYLLFITALGACGVLAYYGGHMIILQGVFIASGLLLLVAAISALWYLQAIFRKTPAEQVALGRQSLLSRIMQSAPGKFLSFIANDRILRFLQYSLCIYLIGFAIIRLFPQHPRTSLATIAFGMALFLVLMVFGVVCQLVEEINGLWEFNKTVRNVVLSLGNAIYAVERRQKEHMAEHERILAAKKVINRSLPEMGNTTEPDKVVDTPSREGKEPNDR